MWSVFLCFQYYRRYGEFCSDFDNFGFIYQNLNLNEILNFDSTAQKRPITFSSIRVKVYKRVLSRLAGNFLVYDFWTPPAPLPPPINFVHGSDKKCLNLS